MFCDLVPRMEEVAKNEKIEFSISPSARTWSCELDVPVDPEGLLTAFESDPSPCDEAYLKFSG